MADKNKPTPGMLGSGMANDAAKKSRAAPAYRDYQMTKLSAGEKPVPMEDWLKGKR